MSGRDIFLNKTFWVTTLRLALPVALQNLLMSSGSMIDSIMVGQLGESALAAVGMAGQWSFFFNVMLFGFSSGGAVFVAQYWGAKDMDGIRRTYGMLLAFALLISIVYAVPAMLAPRYLLSLFTEDAQVIADGSMYLSIIAAGFIFSSIAVTLTTVLRSTESVKLPMVAGMISVDINVAFNYVLIFGKLGFPMLGLRGAAIATCISMIATPVIIFAVSILRHNILIAPLRTIIRFYKENIKKFVSISMPVVAGETLWALGTMGYNMMFGRLGTDNYSALSISQTFQGIAFVFFTGLCSACAVIVGKSVGARDISKAKQDSQRYIIFVPVFSILTGAILVLLRAPLISLFNVSQQVRAIASALTVVYASLAFLRFIPYIAIVGIYRAGGETRIGSIIDNGCLWVAGLPITMLVAFVLKLPLPAVYAVMIISEGAPKTALCIKYYLSYKWIKPLTH